MSSWSLSSLGTYERCGYKYKLKYMDRVPELRSGSANRGVDQHKIVENFIKGELADLPENLAFYKEFLGGLRSYETYPEHRISLRRDWTPTTWSAEDSWFRAVLDLMLINPIPKDQPNWDTHPREITVYDWKTGRIYPDHDDQKSLYSLAAFSENPSVHRVRAIHVYLDLQEFKEVTYTRDDVPELRKRWEERVGRLERDPVLIANPGFYCRFCGYRKGVGGPCIF